ncbi:glycoside hydrolase family 13 protein [Collybiopsis luxurians FD-317 M1]|uniref:Glycoside hydrolase family 13 protein n=1 Tax=Collybiopsis luxurians FD-317 M1 TaxID=944289 RepID=A0A0D0CJS9_9AGAR|nr:glycoside hydrolase family 13 protein [Collybiopsis luxurians FD-317 M1]
MNFLKSLFLRQDPVPLSYMKLGPELSKENPLMIQFFTWDSKATGTSWWKHFENEIPMLAEMGFTQVWLPPPNKAAEKEGRGYDAYDLWDLGEFNQKDTVSTRWGSKEELLSACRAAKEHKIDIIIDAVLNHKLGADRTERFQAIPVNPQDRLKELDKAREIEGWTVFDFPGRGNKYSAMRWNQEHFTGLDWDNATRTKGVFKIVGKGHKGWAKNVDRELGNYDFLLGIDVDHRHPEVQKDFFSWGPWVLETTGAVGFRLDAIKHIDREFTRRFLENTRKSTNRRMFSVAEFWSGNLDAVLPYTRAFKGETAFFDVPLHMNFHDASKHYSRYDLRNVMNNSLVKVKPGYAVTFVDNHETVEGQSLESWVGDHFKIQAYALILLRGAGYPCVFYGDLYPNRECYNEHIARNLKLLIKARQLFAYGATQDYLSTKNCVGFVRTGDSTHSGCAVMLSNREDDYLHVIRMNVGKAHAGSTFRSFLTTDGRVEIDADGWGEFTCFAGSAQVWVKI